MDQSLNAQVKLDVGSDVIRIDVRGSLSQKSRPALMLLIQRIRRMGITSHIRVDLANADCVESSALAGLRNELNDVDLHAVDAGANRLDVGTAVMPARTGVSLELQLFGDDFNRVFQPVDLSGDMLASIDRTGTGPLTRYTSDELLAASDCVFGKLDEPWNGGQTALLARYDDIGLELTRREAGRESEPV